MHLGTDSHSLISFVHVPWYIHLRSLLPVFLSVPLCASLRAFLRVSPPSSLTYLSQEPPPLCVRQVVPEGIV